MPVRNITSACRRCRQRVQHLVAAGTLARLRERDARIDQLLLQLVGAQDGVLLGALRRADAVADDAADHQTDRGTDRAADDRAGRGAAEHAPYPLPS